MDQRLASAGLETADSAGAERPRFRVLQSNGKRKGYRLEEVFWHLLESAAKSGGLRLSDFVSQATADRGDSSGASALRVAAAGWVARKYADLQKATAPERLLRVVQLAPCPCFAIGANRALLSYNQEFAETVRSSMGGGQIAFDVSTARLSLDVPLQRVVEMLQSAEKESVHCGYAIQVGTARRVGKARVVLLPAESATILVGFLVT